MDFLLVIFRRFVGRALAGTMLAYSLTSNALASGASGPTQTYARLAEAARALNHYGVTHSLSDLEAARDDVLSSFVSVHGQTAQQLVAERRAVLSAYDRVLLTVQQAYDPTFDRTGNGPTMCVIPPSGHYPCGVSPSLVSDPTERLRYESEIETNEHKKAQAYRDSRLQYIEDGGYVGIKMVLDVFSRLNAPSDYAALRQIVTTSGLTAERQDKLEAMF